MHNPSTTSASDRAWARAKFQAWADEPTPAEVDAEAARRSLHLRAAWYQLQAALAAKAAGR